MERKTSAITVQSNVETARMRALKLLKKNRYFLVLTANDATFLGNSESLLMSLLKNLRLSSVIM